MPFIVWDGRLDTGRVEIDDQHRVLVEAFNALLTCVEPGTSKDLGEQRLTFFADYTAKHFRMEEAMMLSHQYSGYSRHKALHDQLLEELGNLVTRFRDGRLTISGSVLGFLEGWLLEHIQGEDVRLATYLNRPRE